MLYIDPNNDTTIIMDFNTIEYCSDNNIDFISLLVFDNDITNINTLKEYAEITCTSNLHALKVLQQLESAIIVHKLTNNS